MYTRSLRPLLGLTAIAFVLNASAAIAQAPPPPPAPALAVDNKDSCGWGLGGAAGILGVTALTAPKAGPDVNWTGLYAGGHLGCAWSNNDWTFGNASIFSNNGGRTSFDNSGMIAGGQIGYNLQSGRWIFGLEASLSGGEFKDEKINVLNPTPALNSTKLTSDMRWLFQVTPRIGYAFGSNWQGYVKGGFASAQIDSALFVANGAGASGFAASSTRHSGWTAGAGVEYMLAHNLILGVDYSYVSLDGASRVAGCNGLCGAASPALAVDPDGIHMLTGRLSFKFGSDAPRVVPLK